MGCTSSQVMPLAGVVERSKRYPPSWSKLEDGASWEDKGYIWFLAIERQVDDLSFGVRQVRLSALNGLTNIAKSGSYGGSKQQASEVDTPGALVLKARPILIEPEVFDIYFEKKRLTAENRAKAANSQPYRYDIFVLTRARLP